jgi:tetratricopeptide (TPR) repeat protein
VSPAGVEDILARAQGSARVGDHDETERLLKSYLAKVPDSREAHLLLGTTLAKQGNLKEAEEEFTTMLVKNPDDLEALNNIAVIFRRQNKLDDAIDALVKAIDIQPGKVEFHYNIGNIYKQKGNLAAASAAYGRVVELDPNFVPAYNNLGTIYEQLKKHDKAANVFRKGLLLDRNNPTLHFNYGVTLESQGMLTDAANEYQMALRSKPGWLDPMNNLGIVLFKQGRHDKAMNTFNRILAIDPFNAEARNNMGVVLADQGRTREAVQNYRRAIEADPKYAKAVINLERSLEDSGDFADAIVELEKLVKLAPDSVEVRVRLANLYLKMDRCHEALEQARAALEWDPENVPALKVDGATQRILGNDKLAQTVFERILAIDPQNYSFHLDLADIHFKRKEYKEAEERINAFLARRPNDRQAKILLGKLHAEMGNRTHAIQIFEELAKADPSDTEALTAAAELHKNAGSLEKAVQTADKLVNVQGKRATAEDLSDLNKSLDFYEHAVNAYSNSVKEMWERNMKLAAGTFDSKENSEESGDKHERLGAAEIITIPDDEMESLLVEDLISAKEILQEDEPIDDFIPEEEEEETIPIFDEREQSLDDLVKRPPLILTGGGEDSGISESGGRGFNPGETGNAPGGFGGGIPASGGRETNNDIAGSDAETGDETPKTGGLEDFSDSFENENPAGSIPKDSSPAAGEEARLPAGTDSAVPPPPPQPQIVPIIQPVVFVVKEGEKQQPEQKQPSAEEPQTKSQQPEDAPAEEPAAEEILFEEPAADVQPEAALPELEEFAEPETIPKTGELYVEKAAETEKTFPLEAIPSEAQDLSPPPVDKDATLGLLRYLQHFIDSLPQQARTNFAQNDIQNHMEHLIDVLERHDNV